MANKRAAYVMETPSIGESNEIWKDFSEHKQKKSRMMGLDVTDHDYVSGTGVKNFLLNDPILDVFELQYNEAISGKMLTRNQRKRAMTDFEEEKEKLNVLFEGGNEFERKVMEKLQEQYPHEMLMINSEGRDGYTQANFKKTVQAMMKGIPIICQAVVFNDKNKTSGILDILIRSDYVNKLFKRQVIKKETETFKAPKLKGPYHYRVIDIKWTTMTLCANGYNIRNDDRFPAYKGQLAIYNSIIGEIQGYTPKETYIMAKSWHIDRKNDPQTGHNCFDLLGVIDYSSFDSKYIERTLQGIDWMRDVRTYGSGWDLLNPTREELYPNACNKNDAPWTKYKKDVCEKIGEMTQIWCVTDTHRKTAHQKGIYSWRDPRCDSVTMGITGDVRPAIIDEILEVNRSKHHVLRPDTIHENLSNWQEESHVDFYVDFETINGTLYNPIIDLENSESNADIIFMIGVGHIENNEWKYKVFKMNNVSHDEEMRIANEFTKYITEKTKKLSDDDSKHVARLFHWSQAEVTNFRHLNERHDGMWKDWESSILWTDMYHVFTKEPIVIKGALSFKLKDIGRAFHENGFIQTLWDDVGPSDGFDAMLSAVKYYKKKDAGTLLKEDNDIYKTIIKYNEVDCKVIWEIVDYLRKNRCDVEYVVTA